MSYARASTICLLLVYFVSGAGCHCFDLIMNDRKSREKLFRWVHQFSWRVWSYLYQMQIYVGTLALIRLSGFSEGVGRGRGRLNCQITSIGSISSVKNERSCKNGGLKRIMFRPSHTHLRSYFCFIFSYTLFQY